MNKINKIYSKTKYRDNKFENFEEMNNYYLVKANIVRWLDFQPDTKILEVGAGSGVITNYLLSFTSEVYVYEENEKLLNINKSNNTNLYTVDELESIDLKFDYIVIEGFLDDKLNKKSILQLLKSKLSDNGQIIIFATNRFGSKYFSGCIDEKTKKYFSSLYTNDYKLSINEWDNLFKECNMLGIKRYYPYPDYNFTESIFSESYLPNSGELINNERNFDFDRLEIFNESKFYDSIDNIKDFEMFVNSFLFIFNNKEELPEYVKFSVERDKRFQNITRIFKGKCFVEKKCIFECGNNNLDNIYNFYIDINNRKVFENTNVRLCPVKRKNNSLIFDFINGDSLNNLIEEDVTNLDIEVLKEHLDIIKKIIKINEHEFIMNKGFSDIFGNVDLFEKEMACGIANIDLLAQNIIINEYINIIDYEWIFDFDLPQSFIMYRAMLHSPAINLLDEDNKKQIYSYCGVDYNKRDRYFELEVKFQKYVLGETIPTNKYLDIFGRTNNKIENLNLFKNTFHLEIYDYKERILNQNYTKRNISYKLDNMIDDGNLTIDCNNIVIKISGINIVEDNCDFYDEANKVRYYLKNVDLKFSCDANTEVEIIVYYINDNAINEIVELKKCNENLNNELNIYKYSKYEKIKRKIKRGL